MTGAFILSLVAGVCIAAVAGVIGAFAVTKKMTLAGDVLSHVALPGVGLALAYHFSPTLGAAAALALAAYAIWAVRVRTRLPEETVIGVIFTAALAAGVLITPKEELVETLFGGLRVLTLPETVFAITGSLVVLAGMIFLLRKLTLAVLSPELAAASRLNVQGLELLFLFAFAATVLLGFRFAGTLLMGALIIVPAAAAKNVAPSFKFFLMLSVIFSVVATIAGLLIGNAVHISPGPPAILVGVMFFAATLFFRKA